MRFTYNICGWNGLTLLLFESTHQYFWEKIKLKCQFIVNSINYHIQKDAWMISKQRSKEMLIIKASNPCCKFISNHWLHQHYTVADDFIIPVIAIILISIKWHLNATKCISEKHWIPFKIQIIPHFRKKAAKSAFLRCFVCFKIYMLLNRCILEIRSTWNTVVVIYYVISKWIACQMALIQLISIADYISISHLKK